MYFKQSLPKLAKWYATPGESGGMKECLNPTLPHTCPWGQEAGGIIYYHPAPAHTQG